MAAPLRPVLTPSDLEVGDLVVHRMAQKGSDHGAVVRYVGNCTVVVEFADEDGIDFVIDPTDYLLVATAGELRGKPLLETAKQLRDERLALARR